MYHIAIQVKWWCVSILHCPEYSFEVWMVAVSTGNWCHLWRDLVWI